MRVADRIAPGGASGTFGQSRAGLPDLSRVPAPPSRLLGPSRAFGRQLFRSGFNVHVHGSERVPSAGPVILASNHMGYVDGPLLFTVSPRPVHALVKREMFEGRMGGFLTHPEGPQ